jgi:hypothetical protein
MSTNQAAQWITVAGALVAAGIWLGSLQNRVAQLEKDQHYYHGTLTAAQQRQEGE